MSVIRKKPANAEEYDMYIKPRGTYTEEEKKELEEGHIKFLEYAEKAQKKLARYEKLKK